MREELQSHVAGMQAAHDASQRRESSMRARFQELEAALALRQREVEAHEQELNLATRDAHKARAETERAKQVMRELDGRFEAAAEQQLEETEQALLVAEKFRSTSRAWHHGAVASLSKGVQAALKGVCHDASAHALPRSTQRHSRTRRRPQQVQAPSSSLVSALEQAACESCSDSESEGQGMGAV